LTKEADVSDAIPTVVLVHGAFADASTSNGVTTRLQAACPGAFADAVLEVAGAK
jgi:hypothetical protein